MKLIDRYVSRQVFITGLFAVGVLSVVLVLGNVFKQLLELLVNHDAPLDLILTFIAYILPFSLTFTIPWGFLTAVLLVLHIGVQICRIYYEEDLLRRSCPEYSSYEASRWRVVPYVW